MRLLTDRREIAEATKQMKYPVLLMDISKPKRGWSEGVYEGCKVRVDHEKLYKGMKVYDDCTAMIFVDNGNDGIPDTIENRLKSEISLMPDSICIHDSFCGADILADVEKAQAPVVKAGQIVTVVYRYAVGDDIRVFVRKMKVSSTRQFVYPTAKLTDFEEE